MFVRGDIDAGIFRAQSSGSLEAIFLGVSHRAAILTRTSPILGSDFRGNAPLVPFANLAELLFSLWMRSLMFQCRTGRVSVPKIIGVLMMAQNTEM